MIFVTVGTSSFDSLIEHIDQLVRDGVINDDVVCQIGAGSYLPKHCDFFTYTKDLDSYFKKADLIVSHGGTGTVLELLSSGKKFIVVANTSLADNHQVEFLSGLSDLYPLKWTDNMGDLKEIIQSPINNLKLSTERENLGVYIKNYILDCPVN